MEQQLYRQGHRVRVTLLHTDTPPEQRKPSEKEYVGHLLHPLHVGGVILMQTDKEVQGGHFFKSSGIRHIDTVAKTSSTTGGFNVHTKHSVYHVIALPAPDLPIIPRETLDNVCKPGHGKETCRYVVAGANGIECAKHSDLKATLDARVAAGTFVAQGDNCEGLGLPVR